MSVYPTFDDDEYFTLGPVVQKTAVPPSLRQTTTKITTPSYPQAPVQQHSIPQQQRFEFADQMAMQMNTAPVMIQPPTGTINPRTGSSTDEPIAKRILTIPGITTSCTRSTTAMFTGI
jgi:hypothetical protein